MMQAKLLSMTAVLSVLIWASADSLVSETVSVSVSLEPVPATGTSGMLVESAAPIVPLEIQVSGPRKLAEKIRDMAPLRVRFPVADRATGAASIQLDRNTLKRLLAEQWTDFRKLTVVSVRPDVLHVVVDHWTTKDVALVLSRQSLPYDVEPQIQPPTVSIRMRESRLDSVREGEQLRIDISAESERLLKEQPAGQSVTVTIALDARAYGTDAQVDPAQASVTATVKSESTTAQISTVPILIAVSFPNLEKAVRPVGPDGEPLTLVAPPIQVKGPTDAIARLQQGTTHARGIIHLKHEYLEKLDTPLLLTPEYHLPPGIELAKEPQPVEFSLKDVSRSSGGG